MLLSERAFFFSLFSYHCVYIFYTEKKTWGILCDLILFLFTLHLSINKLLLNILQLKIDECFSY